MTETDRGEVSIRRSEFVGVVTDRRLEDRT